MRYKYPRTSHLPWSLGSTNDDKILQSIDHFIDREVVVTVKLDGECLDGNTLIKTNNGNISIREIVENKLDVLVLTLNEEMEFEYKNIQQYLISENNEDWYEIETESGIKLILTGNHLVFLPELNCFRQVKCMNGDEQFLLLK